MAASVVVPQRGHHHKAHIKKRGHQHHRYKGQLPGKREHYYHGADNIRSVSKHKGQSVNEEAHYLVCIPVYAGHQSARLTARKEGHRQPAQGIEYGGLYVFHHLGHYGGHNAPLHHGKQRLNQLCRKHQPRHYPQRGHVLPGNAQPFKKSRRRFVFGKHAVKQQRAA